MILGAGLKPVLCLQTRMAWEAGRGHISKGQSPAPASDWFSELSGRPDGWRELGRLQEEWVGCV